VEEDVGEALAQAARQLTQRWNGITFARQLAELYQQILAEG